MEQTAAAQAAAFMAEEDVAARSVAAAAPPRVRSVLARQPVTHPMFQPLTADVTVHDHARRVILEGMLHAAPEGHVEWWDASGTNVTAALCEVTGLDKATASHLVGAAAVARTKAGLDRGEDAVLRLAERAACWLDGSLSARQ